MNKFCVVVIALIFVSLSYSQNTLECEVKRSSLSDNTSKSLDVSYDLSKIYKDDPLRKRVAYDIELEVAKEYLDGKVKYQLSLTNDSYVDRVKDVAMAVTIINKEDGGNITLVNDGQFYVAECYCNK